MRKGEESEILCYILYPMKLYSNRKEKLRLFQSNKNPVNSLPLDLLYWKQNNEMATLEDKQILI